MSGSNCNLHIPAEVMVLLQRKAKRLRMSVNTFVLKMIERELGATREKLTNHDLDHLVGSWSAMDAKKFKANTRSFEKVDRE